MSKNIIIQIDGVDQSLSEVEDIQTDRASGGTVKWVIPEEKTLAEISCTQNKTYTAQEAGAYGISKATVNVPVTTVIGKGTDGNTHKWTVDDDGKLHDQVLPEYIAVTTWPTVTTYGEGAVISFEGIVVTAYNGDGSVYDTEDYPGGIIPFEELIFPVTVTPYEPQRMYEYSTSDLIWAGREMVALDGDYDPNFVPMAGPNGCIPAYAIGMDGCIYTGNVVGLVVSDAPGTSKSYTSVDLTWDRSLAVTETRIARSVGLDRQFTYDERTVYYSSIVISASSFPARSGSFEAGMDAPDVFGDPYLNLNTEGMDYLAWTLMYGDKRREGGYQVPVLWNRPEDGYTLETSYGITIVDTSPDGEDSGNASSLIPGEIP